MNSCCVCQKDTNKYKCPSCLEPYCSLDCYKTHKTIPCVRAPVSETVLIVEDRIPQKTILFPTIDTVPLDKLEELRSCESLQSILHNPHLRQILLEVDKAPNAWTALKVAMMEPLFTEFADECLKIVEPQSNCDD